MKFNQPKGTDMPYGLGQAGATTPIRTEAQPAREPQVTGMLNRLNAATDHVDQLISMLEQRLASVLTPTPPDVANKAAREVQVPLAEILDTVTDRVYRVGHTIESMLQRLEL